MALKLTPIAGPHWRVRTTFYVPHGDAQERRAFAADLRAALADVDRDYPPAARGRSGVELRSPECAVILRFPVAPDTTDAASAIVAGTQRIAGLMRRAGDRTNDRLQRTAQLTVTAEWNVGDEAQA
jgi:hypothetical protein